MGLRWIAFTIGTLLAGIGACGGDDDGGDDDTDGGSGGTSAGTAGTAGATAGSNAGGVGGDAGGGADPGVAGTGGAGAGEGGQGGAPSSCVPGVQRVTDAAEASERPALVRTADGFAVAWHDGRDLNNEIYFQRLSDSGEPIGDAVRVTEDAASSNVPSLVVTDDGFGVVFGDTREGPAPDVFFQRLDASGAPVGEALNVSNHGSVSAEAKLVWNGSGYGIAWNDGRLDRFDIWFVELDAEGTPLDNPREISGSGGYDSFRPSLVWTGQGYAVSWNDNREGNWEIHARVLGANTPPLRRVTNDAGQSLFSALAFTGSGFGVAWQEDRDGNDEIYFARLDAAGVKVGSDVRVTDDPAPSGGASLAWDGAAFVLSWDDGRTGDGDIYTVRLDRDGSALSVPIPVSPADGVSIFSSVALAEEGYGIAWSDERDGNAEIYFARMCP